MLGESEKMESLSRLIGRQSSILANLRQLNIVPMVVPACVSRKSLWQQDRPAAKHSVAEKHYPAPFPRHTSDVSKGFSRSRRNRMNLLTQNL